MLYVLEIKTPSRNRLNSAQQCRDSEINGGTPFDLMITGSSREGDLWLLRSVDSKWQDLPASEMRFQQGARVMDFRKR
jgi:hypothetical protein